MSRLLLFDSHCVKCSSAAADIERRTDGRVTPHSLRDPAIRRSLDAAVPGWRNRPMLVDLDETGRIVHAYAGPRFVAKLVSTAGIRGTIRVLRSITDGATQPPSDQSGLSRRSAIARAAGVVGGVLIGTSFLGADALADSSEPRILATTDPALAKLKANAAINDAEQTFGAAGWSDVIASDGVYVVTHAASPDVYTAVAQTGAAAVSFRVSPGSSAKPWQVDWMSTSGTAWATSTATGTVVSRSAAATPDVLDSTWYERFSVCIALCPIQSIAATCQKCGNSGNPKSFNCISCAAKLGGNAIKCAISASKG
jgi:hypothetical protein